MLVFAFFLCILKQYQKEWYGLVWYSMAWHPVAGTVWPDMVRRGMTWHCMAWYGIATSLPAIITDSSADLLHSENCATIAGLRACFVAHFGNLIVTFIVTISRRKKYSLGPNQLPTPDSIVSLRRVNIRAVAVLSLLPTWWRLYCSCCCWILGYVFGGSFVHSLSKKPPNASHGVVDNHTSACNNATIMTIVA